MTSLPRFARSRTTSGERADPPPPTPTPRVSPPPPPFVRVLPHVYSKKKLCNCTDRLSFSTKLLCDSKIGRFFLTLDHFSTPTVSQELTSGRKRKDFLKGKKKFGGGLLLLSLLCESRRVNRNCRSSWQHRNRTGVYCDPSGCVVHLHSIALHTYGKKRERIQFQKSP